MAWDVDRLQLDPCRDLAEYLSIAAVGLDATRADTERWGQSGRNDPDIVSKLAHNVRHAKCLRRALENHPTGRTPLQIAGKPSCSAALLVDDFPIGGTNANLGFCPTEIYRNMVHGWSPSVRLRARFLNEERIFRYIEDGGQPLLAIRSSEPRQQASV